MHATPYGCVVQYSAGQAGIAEQAAVLLATLGELEVRLQLSGD